MVWGSRLQQRNKICRLKAEKHDEDPIVIKRKEEEEDMFREEWDNFRNSTNLDTSLPVNDSFLIKEIFRFVPYMRDGKVKFHPLNMPDIKIGEITIVGLVMRVHESPTHIDILVDDGSGCLYVRYEMEEYIKQRELLQEILEEYQEYANDINNATFYERETCPKSLAEIRPALRYPPQTPIERIAILEAKWSLDTRKGLLGKKIVELDYVMAKGYCNLEFRDPLPVPNKIDYDSLRKAKPVLMATSVECIEESDFNREIKKWICFIAKTRYKMD